MTHPHAFHPPHMVFHFTLFDSFMPCHYFPWYIHTHLCLSVLSWIHVLLQHTPHVHPSDMAFAMVASMHCLIGSMDIPFYHRICTTARGVVPAFSCLNTHSTHTFCSAMQDLVYSSGLNSLFIEPVGSLHRTQRVSFITAPHTYAR